MKIVRFKNGTYGVRKINFWFVPPRCEFIDLKSSEKDGLYDDWCDRPIAILKYCQGTVEEARKAFEVLTDKGAPE